MPKIFELEPHVADLIAAGEVVERPASVVKELAENSIDAGAGIITIEINAGGMTYIRVTDNGCGIAPEDAQTAFLRHATSKLSGAEGLEAIGTLGFRGEALAAIAAVSRIELLTREQGAQEGVRLLLEAGAVLSMAPAGCPEGTTIIVRDLFFNTPARLKFMKSDRAEGSAVASAVLRCALSHPEVSIRLIKDGKTEHHTPGDSRIDSCIYSLFGREFASGLIKAESGDESVSTTGYISSPYAARGNRSYQFFFVNGRAIQSRTLQAALEQAYANTHMSGRYPACALYIKTKPGNVDVNVHPAKTEVKFVSDKQVFDSVYYAALGALSNGQLTMDNGQSAPGNGQWTKGDGRRAIDNGQLRAPLTKDTDPAQRGIDNRPYGTKCHSERSEESQCVAVQEFQDSQFSILNSQLNSVIHTPHSAPGSSDNSQFSILNSQLTSTLLTPHSAVASPGVTYQGRSPLQYDAYQGDRKLPQLVPESEPEAPGPPDLQFRVIGEALSTYIIVEYNGGVWFIDKHAAHERIHFDALRSEGFEPMSQALITPVICRHGYEDATFLLENAEVLEKLGFTVESFGEDAVAVRGIPAEIDIGDTEPVLSEICAQLRLGGMAESARRDSIFRSVACKAAIKAGRSSELSELRTLAARVLSGEVTNCPHGRPVAFELTKTALDRSFKRI